MIFLTYRRVNLIDFCRSLLADKQDPTAIKEVIKSPMQRHKHLVRSVPRDKNKDKSE